MHPTAPIITYCINGTQFYYIRRVQMPLAQEPLQQRVQMPLGNSNKQNKNPIINKGINKNKNNKSIPIKIITKEIVLNSCANGCKWP